MKINGNTFKYTKFRKTARNIVALYEYHNTT